MIPHDDDHHIIHSTDSEEFIVLHVQKVNLNDKKTLNNELNICNKQPLYKESTVDWQIEIKSVKDKNCLDPMLLKFIKKMQKLSCFYKINKYNFILKSVAASLFKTILNVIAL